MRRATSVTELLAGYDTYAGIADIDISATVDPPASTPLCDGSPVLISVSIARAC